MCLLATRTPQNGVAIARELACFIWGMLTGRITALPYTFGFRMLTLGWTDGNSFLPVNHCLLSTENPKYRVNEASPATDLRTNGGKQKAMAQQKMTDIALHLLKKAKAEKNPAQYVLFDSWFCSPSFLIAVRQLKYDVIAMVRKTASQQYRHQGKWMSVKTIYERGKNGVARQKSFFL